MAVLTNLPNEILEQIIFYIHYHRDAAALSVQCHSLHALCDMATRKKYRQIRIAPINWSLDIAFARLMDILKQPRLGHYVRCIENWQKPMESEHYVQGEDQRMLPEEEIELLRDATEKAGFVGSEGEAVMNMLLQKTVDEEHERSDEESDVG